MMPGVFSGPSVSDRHADIQTPASSLRANPGKICVVRQCGSRETAPPAPPAQRTRSSFREIPPAQSHAAIFRRPLRDRWGHSQKSLPYECPLCNTRNQRQMIGDAQNSRTSGLSTPGLHTFQAPAPRVDPVELHQIPFGMVRIRWPDRPPSFASHAPACETEGVEGKRLPPANCPLTGRGL
jgi:hypothetical protein